MKWDAKNLSQFLDTRKATSPVWGWLHLIPVDDEVLWMACDSHNLATFATGAIPGLSEPVVIEEGEAVLRLLHDQECRLEASNNKLHITWTDLGAERVELFDLRPRTKEDPQLDELLNLATDQDRYQQQLLGMQADQFKLLGSMKNLKGKPATVVTCFRGPLWLVDFQLPESECGFYGVLTTNSQFIEAEKA